MHTGAQHTYISFHARERETVHTMRTNDLRRTSATLYKYISLVYYARKTGVENAKVAKTKTCIHSLLAGDEQLRSEKLFKMNFIRVYGVTNKPIRILN